MAADGGQRYELGRLILDYLRTFMWPMVVVAFGIFYWDDLRELVKGREVNIFGAEIGPAVAQLQERTEQELVDLQALVADLKTSYRRELEAALAGQRSPSALAEAPVSEQTREAAQAVEAKLSSLRANLDRETQALREVSVQQALPQQPALPGDALQPAPPPGARADQAAEFERAGFQAILDRRLDEAIAAFESSREVWPDYHNVAEIAAYLAQVKSTTDALDDSDWAAIDRTILTRYSWGMPAQLRDSFRARVTAAR
jgi:hypothetical protein